MIPRIASVLTRLALLTGLCGGCWSESQETYSSEAVASAVLASIPHELTNVRCGAPVTASPAVVVAVSKEHCFACVHLGYWLRTLKRSGVVDVAIVTPHGDAEAVCEFMREQRVKIPVAAVDAIDSLRILRGPMLVKYSHDRSVEFSRQLEPQSLLAIDTVIAVLTAPSTGGFPVESSTDWRH